MRKNYIDSAIGYVQLKREDNKCIVKCEMCPEHKVRTRNYEQIMVVDEEKENIESVKCLGCAASEGGCKHALAFLMWVHDRSTQPASTAVECYWRKPTLSKVGTSLSYITTTDFGAIIPTQTASASTDFLQDFIQEAKEHGAQCQLLKYFDDANQEITSLGLHNLLHLFQKSGQNSYENFLLYAKERMTDELCQKIAYDTKNQSSNSAWFELRYGRITASKIYDAVHTKATDGSFVNTVIGAHKVVQTKAMKRGLLLESAVVKAVEKKVGRKIKQTGLILNRSYPEFGATPDGIADDCVIEIKCPSSNRSYHQYILKNGSISQKYNAQIQLQMFFLNMRKALFCVADPEFEKNNNVTILEVSYDSVFLNNLLEKARKFWKNVIFDRLLKAV